MYWYINTYDGKKYFVRDEAMPTNPYEYFANNDQWMHINDKTRAIDIVFPEITGVTNIPYENLVQKSC